MRMTTAERAGDTGREFPTASRGLSRRRATAVAGPERLCGDWWESEAYRRDYYRVHFEGLGPVWIFRDAEDGRFYLQGMFD